MRILHILDHSLPLHSGYSFRTASILREQRALGWDTIHLTGPKQLDCRQLEESVDGWAYYRTANISRPVSKMPVIRQVAVMHALAERIEKVARQCKPDVLHAHSPVLNAIPALHVGRKLNIPVVYEVRAFWEDAAVDHGTNRERDMRYTLTRALETYACRQADAVTVICEGLYKDIVARGVGAERITVIPNAVDVAEFSAEQRPLPGMAAALGLEDKVVLGFVGSFYRYEGLHVLLQALPHLLERDPRVRILLLGGGPQEQELKRLAATLGIEDKVIFAGRIPHHLVPGYYSLMDVMVYPRIKARITDLVTPLKPLEALAQGKLVAASDVGGHRELIRDGETGILFQSGDPVALAQAVLSLLSQPGRWPAMRAAARHFIEEERVWTVIVGRYRGVYDRLLARRAAR